MTLVIELEQLFQSIAQIDRRGLSSWLSLPNDWWFRKQEARQKMVEEEESF